MGPVLVPLEGGLSVKIASPDPPMGAYRYALLSYRSSYGEEMGRIVVWPRAEPTVYRLGEGMRVRDPFGVLVYEPKKLSRRWFAPGDVLSVVLLADLPDADPSGSITPPGFADTSGEDLTFTTSNGASRIVYPP
jgi:hypothetical protein